eukprot:1751459-Prymnesium_polylepis.1
MDASAEQRGEALRAGCEALLDAAARVMRAVPEGLRTLCCEIAEAARTWPPAGPVRAASAISQQ